MSTAVAQALSRPLHATVSAARAGDGSAWDELFNRFHRRVLRYAIARLGDHDGAEDVMQDVFVAAVQSLPRLRDTSESGVESWLLRITTHKVADRIRARRKDRVPAPEEMASADPGEVAVSRMSLGEMRSALDRLSDEQRDVILRRFVLDQSLEQVAAATGRPIGAVKSMQRRGLASLAKLCTERRS